MVAGSAARFVGTAHAVTDEDLRGTSGLPRPATSGGALQHAHMLRPDDAAMLTLNA
jgi:hypothetical protein